MSLLNNLKLDVTSFLAKMPTAQIKGSDASLLAASVVGTITAIQLLTDMDPVGRCVTFWSQLRRHVRKKVGSDTALATEIRAMFVGDFA